MAWFKTILALFGIDRGQERDNAVDTSAIVSKSILSPISLADQLRAKALSQNRDKFKKKILEFINQAAALGLMSVRIGLVEFISGESSENRCLLLRNDEQFLSYIGKIVKDMGLVYHLESPSKVLVIKW